MMARILITCPECRQHLSFEEITGYQNMLVECPKCHFKANVSVYQNGGGARGSHGADEMSTKILYAPSSSIDVGQIRVLSTNEVQYLKIGSNVIGRRAQSGNADIKISNDMYMSRRNVQIDVVKKSTGFEHRLVEIGSTNTVKLNGTPVNRGDILIIKFGDVLTLGHTEIRLESNSDEATRIFSADN